MNSPNVFLDAKDLDVLIEAWRRRHAELCGHLTEALSAGRTDAAGMISQAVADVEARIVRLNDQAFSTTT